MMTRQQMIVATGLVAFALHSSIVADVGELNNEPIYTVTVPASVSNSFNSASPGFTITKTVGGIVVDSSYSEFFSETAAGTLVKKGPGWLTVDEGLVNWTGQIIVDEGVFCGACSNALGKVMVDPASTTIYSSDADGTFVHDGATLFMDASFCKGGPAREKKKITLAGDGAPGMGGALVAHGRGLTGFTAWPWGDNPTLSADATVVNDISKENDARLSFNRKAQPGEFMDLKGHTLTIVNGEEISIPNLNYNRGTFTNGNITVNGTLLHFQNDTSLAGGAGNILKMDNGSAIEFEEISGGIRSWKLSVESMAYLQTGWYDNFASSSSVYGYGDGATNGASWHGEIVLNGNIKLRQLAKSQPVGITFFGRLTGDGGFCSYSSRAAPLWLHLCNPANTFAGGIGVRDTIVQAYAPGAIPVNGGNLAITNGALYLGAGSDYISPNMLSYSMPPVEFCGTGMVHNGTGVWRDRLTKTGDGELVLDTTMCAPLLDVRGGGVRIARYGTPGLYEGIEDHNTGVDGDGWYKKQTTLFSEKANPHLATNCVRLLPRMAYARGSNQGWSPRLYITYSGYIWNRSNVTQNWTFYGGIQEGHEICLDGHEVIYRIDNGSVYKCDMNTVPVTPGPHALRIRMYVGAFVDASNGGALSADRVNNNNSGMNWTNNFGLAFDRQGRNSVNWYDYERIEDPGDGSLLTISTNSVTDGIAARCEFQKLRLASGTYVDFNAIDGAPYELTELYGTAAALSNVNLRVTGAWTVPADGLSSGPLAVVGKLTFAAGSMVEVSDALTLPRRDFLLCTATGGIEGLPACEQMKGGRKMWRLRMCKDESGNDALMLCRNRLFTVSFH